MALPKISTMRILTKRAGLAASERAAAEGAATGEAPAMLVAEAATSYKLAEPGPWISARAAQCLFT